MQQGLVTQLATAFEQNDSSPGGYDAAIKEVQQKFLADPMLNDPVVRESFERLWAEKTTIGRMTVANRHAAAVRAEAAAAATEGLETLRADLERDAYRMGGNPAGDAAITSQMSRIDSQRSCLGVTGSCARSAAAAWAAWNSRTTSSSTARWPSSD